ncbi:MAG TPA: homoserine dehydrogenase [Candidatus Binatia bacterium]
MAEKRKKIGIGLLGAGTVGQSVQDFLFQDAKRGADPELEIVKIYTRHPKGKKWYGSHPGLFTTKAEEVVDHPGADIIVEALGFQDEKDLAGFKDLIVRALKKGKAVVTSDKAVLARYGREIWEAARKHGGELRFEACVAGGVPIIRSITESFAAEEPQAIYGIVNGTCNYILSEMARGGKSYDAALQEAQQRGYAETNPSADTGGKDAEAKLILLAAVAFGLQTEPGVVWRKGIEEIDALDFLYASRKGRSTIKHLAVARRENGSVQAYVSPVLVGQEHSLASINGATNALFFKGRRSGEPNDGRDWNYVFAGPGAGGGPTAVALLGDVCDVARRSPQRSMPGPLVKPGALSIQAEDEIAACFYIRFVVKDRAGIVGDICQTLGKAGINISEIWQLSHSREELEGLARRYRIGEKPIGILPFVITLERASIGQIKNAMKVISRRDYMLAEPCWFPIWTG